MASVLSATPARSSRLRSPERYDPNWEVHQKDHAPGKPEQVSLDEDSPKDKPGDVGKADRYAHHAERRPTLAVIGEGHSYQRKYLRGEHRCGGALQQPAGNKNLNVRRDPADERRQRERCKGHHENTTLAVDIAKSSPGNHSGGKGQCVACYREFGLAEARVQCASNDRNRHVDDRAVHDRHKNAREHDSERHPAAGVDARAGDLCARFEVAQSVTTILPNWPLFSR
jgi:hypothetical protein